MAEFSHFDDQGRTRMVDVDAKPVTERITRASAHTSMNPDTLSRIKERDFAKGDVLEVARLAAIMGAKETSRLIPLCHPIPLSSVEIDFSFPDNSTVRVEATVRVSAKTGVEMEAMTAVTVASLTIYDMCKSADRQIVIGSVQLEEKIGGKSGHFIRSTA